MLTTARIVVAKFEKKESLPETIEWESRCWYIIMTVNKLTAIIRRNIENFTKIWESVFIFGDKNK